MGVKRIKQTVGGKRGGGGGGLKREYGLGHLTQPW